MKTEPNTSLAFSPHIVQVDKKRNALWLFSSVQRATGEMLWQNTLRQVQSTLTIRKGIILEEKKSYMCLHLKTSVGFIMTLILVNMKYFFPDILEKQAISEMIFWQIVA